MKKILTSFIAVCGVLLLMITSCKKDETKTTAALGNSGTIAASTTTPPLSLATETNPAVTLNLSAATPVTGYKSVAVTYTLQIGKKGSNFVVPQEISATVTGVTLTQDALNTVLHNLKLVDGVSTQVEVRMKSSVAANIDAAYSNVITLTVTPYSRTSYLYVPGAYQGWDPTAANVGSLASPTSNNIYDGNITFTTGNLAFKITTKKNWDVAYGNGGSGKLSLTGGDLTVPSAGTYAIHVDMTTLSYTLTKQ
ncbi:SusE domain-containing protein [Mucilaginibacter terrae]|uniref:SusE domain-containing protein n=1 Tax=Mucilaginibacter terrae TaxID=1955052 RepID=UPI0036378172